MPTRDAAAEKNVVQSLGKGLRVLEAFTTEAPELTLAEVARRTGSDNATAFRFLNTLVLLGYVERVPDSRHFRLTLKCLGLGFNAIARSDLRALARPVLRALVGEVNEAASVGVLDGPDVVYIERIQAGLTRLGVDVRIGSRVPAYATAIGQAILSGLPREAQIQILERRTLDPLTPFTLTSLDALLARLELVRARGYALSDQETVLGLRVLSAPVVDLDGVPVAGLSVAAPGSRMTIAAFEEAARGPVLAAAAALSRAIQASGGFTAQIAAN
ncbi:MAG: helix-turn-helix domain-containing protein [Rhodospirillales bacterium]|nr:helix-turn-helix domain-containing protein [Rhodospirillales bacterium]